MHDDIFQMKKEILELFWVAIIVMFHKSAYSDNVCSCEQVPVITAGSDPTYKHHSITLPEVGELETLTQETQTIIDQIKCYPTNYIAGPGEAFFLCPSAFVPCPPVLSSSPEIYQASTSQNFTLPIPLLMHLGKLYIVDEIASIKEVTKAQAESVLQVNDWPDLLPGIPQPAFHFVYKYGMQVWMDPPDVVRKLCRLPKSLFEEQIELEDVLVRLLTNIDKYKELVSGQVVKTQLTFPNSKLISNNPLTSERPSDSVGDGTPKDGRKRRHADDVSKIQPSVGVYANASKEVIKKNDKGTGRFEEIVKLRSEEAIGTENDASSESHAEGSEIVNSRFNIVEEEAVIVTSDKKTENVLSEERHEDPVKASSLPMESLANTMRHAPTKYYKNHFFIQAHLLPRTPVNIIQFSDIENRITQENSLQKK